MIFSADDTCDVGGEGGAVVSEDYGSRGNEFNGEVNWVQIDLAEAAEDLDHLITPGGTAPHRHGQAVASKAGSAPAGPGLSGQSRTG
jgi:hypothetical protein